MKKAILASALTMILAGCGGGGSSDTVAAAEPNPSTPTETETSPPTEEADQGEQTEEQVEEDSQPEQEESEPEQETSEEVTTSCQQTDVGIAFQAINATVISDSNAAPSELIDGCVGRENSWSGDKGSIVTLDAGSVHQMQGVYIWSTFARMEVLKIQSSADGLNWTTDYHLVPTKPVAGPVYYPLEQATAKRYIRVTGFGSDLNNWTNLTEIRWSLTGYNVSGNRVLRNTTAENHEGFSHSRHLLLQMTHGQTSHATYLRQRCPIGEELSSADVTGTLNEFMTSLEVNGRMLYLFDWDHYPYRYTPNTDMFDYVLEPHNNYSDYLMRQPGFSAYGEQGCSSSGLGDALYSSGTIVQELVQGRTQPNNGNWQ